MLGSFIVITSKTLSVTTPTKVRIETLLENIKEIILVIILV